MVSGKKMSYFVREQTCLANKYNKIKTESYSQVKMTFEYFWYSLTHGRCRSRFLNDLPILGPYESKSRKALHSF